MYMYIYMYINYGNDRFNIHLSQHSTYKPRPIGGYTPAYVWKYKTPHKQVYTCICTYTPLGRGLYTTYTYTRTYMYMYVALQWWIGILPGYYYTRNLSGLKYNTKVQIPQPVITIS